MISPLRRSTLRPWLALLATAITLSITGARAQEQEARLVKDVNLQQAQYGTEITWVKLLGKKAVFARTTDAHGTELWTTNGTLKGTRLLKDFLPGPRGSSPRNPVAFGKGNTARVAFIVADPVYPAEVWITDGTEDGTMRIHQSGSGSGLQTNDATSSGFFFTQSNFPGNDLYFSDGTVTGTRLITPAGAENPQRFSLPFVPFSDGPWGYISTSNGEIWRSDGTDAGTTKIVTTPPSHDGTAVVEAIAGGRLFIQMNDDQDIRNPISEVWSCTMDGGDLTRLNPATGEPWAGIWPYHVAEDQVFFSVMDYSYTTHLWVSDGTAEGTRKIHLPYEEGEVAMNATIASWHGSIYYLAELWDDTRYYFILFCTDGTEAGTKRLGTFNGASLLPHSTWREKEGFFYFSVTGEDGTADIWRTKGTPATTGPAKGLASNHYLRIANEDLITSTDSGMYYAASSTGKNTFGESLWRQRGKIGGATRLTIPEPRTESGAVSFNPDIFPSGSQVLTYEIAGQNLLSFVKADDDGHYELWRMDHDGSRAKAIWQTSKPITSSYAGLGFRGTTPHGAIFTYTDGMALREVWITDGTKKGTQRLMDHSGTDGTYLAHFIKLGNVWFYSMAGHPGGPEGSLWKTDGTPAGTTRVLAADGTSPSVSPSNLVAFQDSVFFSAYAPNGSASLWRSDGTPAGTVMVTDSFHEYGNEAPVGFSVVGGKIMFSQPLSNSQILWQSDGTAAGTVPVNTPLSFKRWGVDSPVDVNGIAIFPATRKVLDGNSYRQWWCSDATGIRTLRNGVNRDDLVSEHSSGPMKAVTGSRFYYSSWGKMWVSDGTAAGTYDLRQLTSNAFSSPCELIAVGDHVYFSAYSYGHGIELWRTDGTEAGTVLVADIWPNEGDSEPKGLKVMNGKLYFTAYRPATGRELFSIDLPQ